MNDPEEIRALSVDENPAATSDHIAHARELGYRAGWNDALRTVARMLDAKRKAREPEAAPEPAGPFGRALAEMESAGLSDDDHMPADPDRPIPYEIVEVKS